MSGCRYEQFGVEVAIAQGLAIRYRQDALTELLDLCLNPVVCPAVS